jgi:hypothetical protein
MQLPFQASFADVRANLDPYVEAVFKGLRSEFMTLPKGPGFIDYPTFERGYQQLKQSSRDFKVLKPDRVAKLVCDEPVVFIVLRTMLGFTPPEWAYATSESTQVDVTQGAIRALDRRIRLAPTTPLVVKPGVTSDRLKALVLSACKMLTDGPPDTPDSLLHRLDKADTKRGLKSVRPLADIGVPYAMLLYERFLGRPFAGHRDSVSELVGNVLEAAIESVLAEAKISFRKTKRAERVEGFDQAPDFIVPDEFSPQVIIEAKISEDDGTARDKISRLQHLAELSMHGVKAGGNPRFEVVACIAGRGFRVRREDMKKLILATRGKVFTLQHLDRLVDCSQLSRFASAKR